MSYPRQEPTLRRLEEETRKSMRASEKKLLDEARRLWTFTRSSMRNAIITEYRRDFPRGYWNYPNARRFGTLLRIERATKEIMSAFTHALAEHGRKSVGGVYLAEKLRAVWMLDQTTPSQVMIKESDKSWDPKRRLKEAGMVNTIVGEQARVQWEQRWSAWATAYENSLIQNLNLEALNEGPPEDAADEIDATRPGSPSLDLWDVIDRLLTTEFIAAEAQARQDVTEANSHVVLTEIWQTMSDFRVCDTCDPLNGLERDDVNGEEMPLHPRCRCYWRVVPKEWQQLLRGRDPDLARYMDERGLVPDSMIVRDDNGNPQASVIINFEKWTQGMARTIQ